MDARPLRAVLLLGLSGADLSAHLASALFRIFGVNIESVTIVVTAFMLGLGLGSLVGGWLSKRRGIPLLPLLAAIELMTGPAADRALFGYPCPHRRRTAVTDDNMGSEWRYSLGLE